MKRSLVTIVALAALAVGPVPADDDAGLAALQAPEDEPVVVAARQLTLGQVFSSPFYEIGASGLVVEPSPVVGGISEVRLSFAYHNMSPLPVVNWTPGIETPGFPELVLRDGNGDTHAIDLGHPGRAALAGSTVDEILPGSAARWTLGFQVPTAAAAGMSLVALDGGVPLAEWALTDSTARITFSPPDLPVVALDQPLEWLPGLEVTPRATGSLVCGDPAIESVAHVFAVTFDVRNTTSSEVRWPGYVHRDPAPIAQWADGSGATMSLETFWGDRETLPRVSGHAVLMPALTSATRALVFAAPRDGRFTDVRRTPSGVRIPTAAGEMWLDLSAVTPSIGIDPAMCDLGGAGAPIPFAFAPGSKYQVGGESFIASRAERDEAARSLLTTALAGATRHFDANAQSIAGLDEDAFDAVVPSVAMVEIRPGIDQPSGAVGEVYFDIDPTRRRFVFLATRSASGTWFCSAGDLFAVPVLTTGGTLTEAGLGCYPEAFTPATGS